MKLTRLVALLVVAVMFIPLAATAHTNASQTKQTTVSGCTKKGDNASYQSVTAVGVTTNISGCNKIQLKIGYWNTSGGFVLVSVLGNSVVSRTKVGHLRYTDHNAKACSGCAWSGFRKAQHY